MVQGTDTYNFEFINPETQQKFTLNTTFNEGIKLKLLERIAKALEVKR